MIYVSIFFIAWSLAAIYFLYKEKKNNRLDIFIWITVLIVWSFVFYKEIGKYL